MTKVEKTGEHEITFTFDGPGNRELPQIVGQINVLPKHWYEGTDKSGKKRDITATSLEPPLGNGAYRMKEFVPGRSIVYERVKDYWGKDLPVNIGRDNFDELRFEYFRDSTVALEAFKGDQLDWRNENVAKNWATAYDFPAVNDKRVVKEEFPIRNQGIMQGFVLNTRRAKFSDPRVRRAFNLALDFEEMNKQFFYGAYKRIGSFFEGSELASSGLPTGLELEILETVRDQVPPEVFTTEYKNPVNGSPEAVRNNLREATRLLREAGYEIRNQKLVNAKTGEPMTVEFLFDEPVFERFALFYKPILERLGIGVTVRTIDDAQYENRVRAFDFDVIVGSWGESLSPGNEQRGFWGSQAADQPGSRNLIGIKNPAVDKLIDRVVVRQEPGGSGRRHQGARSRAAVEQLHRAAMDLWQGADGALGPVLPSRQAARIRRVGVPDRVVVGCGQGGEDREPPVTRDGDGLTRRKVLVLSAGAITATAIACARPDAAAADEDEVHGMSGFGDLKYPRDFRRFEYVDPNAPKGGVFSETVTSRLYNQNFLTFNSLNSFIFKGDAARGMELTFATLMVPACRRARCDVWPRRPRGAGLAGRARLSLCVAPGGAVSRRHQIDRARCRVFAQSSQGEGPSHHLAAPARNGGRRSRRRSNPGRALRRKARARCPVVRGQLADFLAGLLHRA